METRPQTVSPRRTRDKADLGLSLQIPSPSHLAPKSLRADSYYVSENQGGHPREAHWTLPAPSAHAERGHLRDRTKETEPKSLPGDRRRDGGGGGGPTQRRVDDDVQAARFELVAEEKESVPVPLPGEPLESGQSITC